MNQRWRWVSTSECVIDKIKNGMPQPVGIIVFGADCEFKNEVRETFLAGFHGGLLWDYFSKATIGRTKEILSIPKSFMVVFDSDESSDHSLRHQCVMNLKGLGAASVVEVYIKATQNSPTADGLEYLIEISEEEGQI